MYEHWLSRDYLNPNSRHKPLSASQFVKDASSNVEFVRRLSTTASLVGHDEVVHALSWSNDGRLIVTGSEDCKAKVWDAARSKAVASFDTGHTSSIFCAKFMPGTSNEQIVTASADKQVRVINLQRAAAKPYHSHRGRVRSVAPVNPFEFLSAGEDGTVRQFDSRDTPPSSRSQDWNAAFDRRSVVVDQKGEPGGKVAIYCLAADPVRPHLLATGGSDAIVRVFDRRYIPAASARSRTQWAYCLVPDHLVRATRTTMFAGLPVTISRLHHITGISFSHTGEQLVASYAGEHIYTFDTTEHAQGYDTIAASVQDRYMRTSFPTGQRRGAVFAASVPPTASSRATASSQAAAPARSSTSGRQDARSNPSSLTSPPLAGPATSGGAEATGRLILPDNPPSPPPRPPAASGIPGPDVPLPTGNRAMRHVTLMTITPHAVYSHPMPVQLPPDLPGLDRAAQHQPAGPRHTAPGTIISVNTGADRTARAQARQALLARPSAASHPSFTAAPLPMPSVPPLPRPTQPTHPGTTTAVHASTQPVGENGQHISSEHGNDNAAVHDGTQRGAGPRRPPIAPSMAALAAAAAALEESLAPYEVQSTTRPASTHRNRPATNQLTLTAATSTPQPGTAVGPSVQQITAGPSGRNGASRPGPSEAARDDSATDAEDQTRKRRRLSLFPPRFTSGTPPPPSHILPVPQQPPTTTNPHPSQGRSHTANTSTVSSGGRNRVLSLIQSWAALSQRYLGLSRSAPATPTSQAPTTQPTAATRRHSTGSPTPDNSAAILPISRAQTSPPGLHPHHDYLGSRQQNASADNRPQETASREAIVETASREAIVAVQSGQDHAEASSAPATANPTSTAASNYQAHNPDGIVVGANAPDKGSDMHKETEGHAPQMPGVDSHQLHNGGGAAASPHGKKRSRQEGDGSGKDDSDGDTDGSDSEAGLPDPIPSRGPALFMNAQADSAPQSGPKQSTGGLGAAPNMELDSQVAASVPQARMLVEGVSVDGVRLERAASPPRPANATADGSLSLRHHLSTQHTSPDAAQGSVNDDTDSTHGITTAAPDTDCQEHVSAIRPTTELTSRVRCTSPGAQTRSLDAAAGAAPTLPTARQQSSIGRCGLSRALSPTSSSVQLAANSSLPVSPTSQHANLSALMPSANTGEEPMSLHAACAGTATAQGPASTPLNIRGVGCGSRYAQDATQPGAGLHSQAPGPENSVSSDDVASREARPPGKRQRHEHPPHPTSSLSLTSAPPAPSHPAGGNKKGRKSSEPSRSAPANHSAVFGGSGNLSNQSLPPQPVPSNPHPSSRHSPANTSPAHLSPVSPHQATIAPGLTSPTRWPPSPGRSAFTLVRSPRQMERLMREESGHQAAAVDAQGGNTTREDSSAPAAGNAGAANNVPSGTSAYVTPAKTAAPAFKPPPPMPRHLSIPHPSHGDATPAHAAVIASPPSLSALRADASSRPRDNPSAHPPPHLHPPSIAPPASDRPARRGDRCLFSPTPALHTRARHNEAQGTEHTRPRVVFEATGHEAIDHGQASHNIPLGHMPQEPTTNPPPLHSAPVSQSQHGGAQASVSGVQHGGGGTGASRAASQGQGRGGSDQAVQDAQGQGGNRHHRGARRLRRGTSRTHVIIHVSTSFHPGGDNSDDDMAGPGMPDLSSPLLSGPFFQRYMQSEFRATLPLPFTFGAGGIAGAGGLFTTGLDAPPRDGARAPREATNRGGSSNRGGNRPAGGPTTGRVPAGPAERDPHGGAREGRQVDAVGESARTARHGEGDAGAGEPPQGRGPGSRRSRLALHRERLGNLLGQMRAQISRANMDERERRGLDASDAPATQGTRVSTASQTHGEDRETRPAAPGEQAGIFRGAQTGAPPGHAQGLESGRNGLAAQRRSLGTILGQMRAEMNLEAQDERELGRPEQPAAQATGAGGSTAGQRMHGGSAIGTGRTNPTASTSQPAGPVTSGSRRPTLGDGDRHVSSGIGEPSRAGSGHMVAGQREGDANDLGGGWRPGDGWRAASERWAGVSPWRAASRLEGGWLNGDRHRRGEQRARSSDTDMDRSRLTASAALGPGSERAQLQGAGLNLAGGVSGSGAGGSGRDNAASGPGRSDTALPRFTAGRETNRPSTSGQGRSVDGLPGLPEGGVGGSLHPTNSGRQTDIQRILTRRLVRAEREAGRAGRPRDQDSDAGGGERARLQSRIQGEEESRALGLQPPWDGDIWRMRSPTGRSGEGDSLWQYRSRDRVSQPAERDAAEGDGEEDEDMPRFRRRRTGPVVLDDDMSEDEEEEQPRLESGHYQQRFTGHKNQRFTKEGYKMEVSYLGPTSEFIMSGSDTGKIYIWQAKTGRLINILETEDMVASCVQPHPQDMCFASSGHQPVVKLWHPVAENPAPFPLEQEGAPQQDEEANLPGLNTILSVMQVLGHGMGEASLEVPVGPPPPPPGVGQERNTENRWSPPAREVGGECSIM